MNNLKSDTGRTELNETKNKIKIKETSTQKKCIKIKCSFSILNIIVNSVISIFVIFLIYCVFNNYEKKWVIIFCLTFISLFMNEFYFLNITILDYICLFKNTLFKKKCIKYNDFIRNYYLRICFPFSISIVFLYWMLILLGDDFQYASRSLWDNCISFTFHGLVFIFLLYDTFTYPHVNKKNRKLPDFIIISSIIIVYFVILGFAKYMLYYNPYDFMWDSDIRQIAAAGILIYMAIMDGYIAFVLIANRFFIQEDDKNKVNEKPIDEKAPLNEKISENEKKEESGQIKENGNGNVNKNENTDNKNIYINILTRPKNSNKIMLKPLNLNKKKEQNVINK